MAEAASAVLEDPADQQPPPDAKLRPGWVLETVVAVLASSAEPLRPQEVMLQAGRMRGRAVAASSIRNALRVASQDSHGPIERVRYGLYRLRRGPQASPPSDRSRRHGYKPDGPP